jgi:hypothetical protein
VQSLCHLLLAFWQLGVHHLNLVLSCVPMFKSGVLGSVIAAIRKVSNLSVGSVSSFSACCGASDRLDFVRVFRGFMNNST